MNNVLYFFPDGWTTLMVYAGKQRIMRERQFPSIVIFFDSSTAFAAYIESYIYKKKQSDNLLKLLSAHHLSFPPGHIRKTLSI